MSGVSYLPQCPVCLKRISREEPAIEKHYVEEHGASIYSECADCGESFISLKPAGDGRGIYRSYCRDCTYEDPLRGLLVEEVVDFENVREPPVNEVEEESG